MRKIEEIKNEFDIEKWDTAAVHPMQSWEWGEAKKELGSKVIRFIEFEDEVIINVFQMTLHKIPLMNKYIGYMPMSPLVSEEAFLKLKEIAVNEGCIFIKIEPYISVGQKNNMISSSKSVNLNLVKSPHPLLFNWTMILDLNKSEEELLSLQKQKTRYNVRLADKKGVIAEVQDNDKGFKEFTELFFDTAKRRGYISHTPYYHKIIWKHLKDKISHILTVSFNGTPLGAYELFYFNETLYYPYGGTSDEHRNLMSANLLMWESIKFGKKLGAKKYDMWGGNPPDPKSPDYKVGWEGLTKFKDGYGAEYMELIGAHDLIINSIHYKLYNIAEKMRSLYLSKLKAKSTDE